MHQTNIELELAAGEITLLTAGSAETLSTIVKRTYLALQESLQQYASKNQTYMIHLGDLYLDDNPVSISVRFDQKVQHVDISTNVNKHKSSDVMEAKASKIAQSIAAVWPGPDFKMSHVFPWGELIIRTEWRDGGYGAEFNYK